MDFNITCVKCQTSKIAGISFYKSDDNIYSNTCVKCKPKRVNYYKKNHKYFYPKPPPKPKNFYKYPHSLRVKIRSDIKSGISYRATAKKYNIKYQNLMNYKKKNQI